MIEGDFISASAGSKHVSTGLTWSRPSPSTLTWHQAVWEYIADTFNTGDPMDGSDSGRTNDYDGGSSGGTPDAHTTNYCHQLVEGGQSDWRLPTSSELSTMMNNGATSSYMDFFAPGTAKNFWSSNSSGANAGIFNIQSNGLPATVNQPKNTAGGVTCVRP